MSYKNPSSICHRHSYKHIVFYFTFPQNLILEFWATRLHHLDLLSQLRRLNSVKNQLEQFADPESLKNFESVGSGGGDAMKWAAWIDEFCFSHAVPWGRMYHHVPPMFVIHCIPWLGLQSVYIPSYPCSYLTIVRVIVISIVIIRIEKKMSCKGEANFGAASA